MADAKATICYLNGLSLHTINEVEKILRGLPQKGTRCEVQMSKPLTGEHSRGTGDVIASKSMQIRDEPRPLTLSPKSKDNIEKNLNELLSKSEEQQDSLSEFIGKPVKTTNNDKPICKVLTDHVRVSPILSCVGVILEVDVEINVPGKEKVKQLHIEIECPDFIPARIKIGKKWKNIV